MFIYMQRAYQFTDHIQVQVGGTFVGIIFFFHFHSLQSALHFKRIMIVKYSFSVAKRFSFGLFLSTGQFTFL